ncbi:MAG: outer membrane protein transport protein [Deltaproteobacteria bacterium]|nr:outer membrane protein transport protein [Deltaproteobacteria bacterium]
MPSWNFGVLLRPHPSLTIGVAAISRSDAKVQGDVTVRLGPDAFIPTEIRGTQRTGLVIPWTLMLGANWDVTRHLEAGVELRCFFYSAWRNQHTDISDIPLMTERDVPKNYHDSWHLSGGVLWHSVVPRLEGLAGLQYDASPAPPETVSLDQPSFDSVGLHAGLRYRLGARYRLGLTYSYCWYLRRQVENSVVQPPFNFAGSGGCNLVTVTLEVRFDRGLGVR